MNKIKALRGFLSWFEDNFGEESYLHSFTDEEWEEMHSRYSIEEMDRFFPEGNEWRSYLELPEYQEAKKALDFMPE
jgi:hypothetical protein